MSEHTAIGEDVQAAGNIATAVLQAARDRDAAPSVAGSPGRSVRGGILLGSGSARPVHHSPVRVLIAPTRD